MDTPETVNDDLKALTVRIPYILHARIKGDVERRKAAGERKFSMADWFVEAGREKIDNLSTGNWKPGEQGPEQRNSVENSTRAIAAREDGGFVSVGGLITDMEALAAKNLAEKTGSGNVKPKTLAIQAALGIKTLATIEEVEPRMDSDSGYIAPKSVAPVVQQEHMPSRNWGKFFAEMDEMEPGEAKYAWDEAVADIKLPARFRDRPRQKQIGWLNANA